MCYYVSKSESKALRPIGFEFEVSVVVERKHPTFDPAVADKMIKSGKTLTEVKEYFGAGSEKIKELLEKHGIKYKVQGRKSYANALKFDEIADFKQYLTSIGIQTSGSKKKHIAFNARTTAWTAVEIIKPTNGEPYLRMNGGLIGHYKKWKGIK